MAAQQGRTLARVMPRASERVCRAADKGRGAGGAEAPPASKWLRDPRPQRAAHLSGPHLPSAHGDSACPRFTVSGTSPPGDTQGQHLLYHNFTV